MYKKHRNHLKGLINSRGNLSVIFELMINIYGSYRIESRTTRLAQLCRCITLTLRRHARLAAQKFYSVLYTSSPVKIPRRGTNHAKPRLQNEVDSTAYPVLT